MGELLHLSMTKEPLNKRIHISISESMAARIAAAVEQDGGTDASKVIRKALKVYLDALCIK